MEMYPSTVLYAVSLITDKKHKTTDKKYFNAKNGKI